MAESLNDVVKTVDNMQAEFTDLFDLILTGYTNDIDKVLKDINDNLIINKICPSSDDIEIYMLKLNNEIYKLSDNIERIGIYDSVSKAIYKDCYNQIYLNNQIKDGEKKNKTTVAELTALSEQGTVYENLVNDVYNRVYKTLKIKLDAAQSMLSTLSKLLSKRMQDAQMVVPTGMSSKQISSNPFYVTTEGAEYAI